SRGMAISINPSVPVIGAQAVGSATDGVVLQPGTVVSAQVQNELAENLVRLQIVGAGAGAAAGDAVTLAPNLAPNAPVGPAANVAAASDPLTPLERIAVSVATESAATTQQSLAPLFANLNAAASANGLPPALQQVIANVLAQQTSLDPDLGGGDIQNAFQKSGLFLEASLASGTAPSGSTPDLK